MEINEKTKKFIAKQNLSNEQIYEALREYAIAEKDVVMMKEVLNKNTSSLNEKVFIKVAEKMNSDYIRIDAGNSQIWLQIQDGPIKEVEENGCQIDDIGSIWLEILKGFNKQFPCRENSLSITKIEEALMWQTKRKTDRLTRGVEGYNKK